MRFVKAVKARAQARQRSRSRSALALPEWRTTLRSTSLRRRAREPRGANRMRIPK